MSIEQHLPPEIKKLHQTLIDNGLLIEAGFISLKAMAIPADAPLIQIDEMRHAFFAGAQHLFSSIMLMLDPDIEPTDNDMRRMNNIQKELDLFIENFQMKHVPTKGSA